MSNTNEDESGKAHLSNGLSAVDNEPVSSSLDDEGLEDAAVLIGDGETSLRQFSAEGNSNQHLGSRDDDDESWSPEMEDTVGQPLNFAGCCARVVFCLFSQLEHLISLNPI